jgi:DNA modification methylase
MKPRNIWKAGCLETCTSGLGLGSGCNPPTYTTHILQSFDGTAGIVFEPFCGSGTTVIAAEKLKRRCFAMELDGIYCDIAVKRYEDFSGKKAVRYGKA